MSDPITLDDIYALFRESEQQRKEYQQAFEERQRTYEQNQEQHRQVYEQEMADLRKIVAQTNKQVGGITSRWGEFVENLVRPAAAKYFNHRELMFTILLYELTLKMLKAP